MPSCHFRDRLVDQRQHHRSTISLTGSPAFNAAAGPPESSSGVSVGCRSPPPGSSMVAAA